MSLDDPEYAQHAVLEFLYSAIFLVCEKIMTCDTEWRAFDRNL